MSFPREVSRLVMKLAIVVPCFNEQEVLPKTHRTLLATAERLVKKGLVDEARLVYVDDGSADETWSLVEALGGSPWVRVTGVKLSRNVGHESAMLAGLSACRGWADCAITIDADLQDDVTVIDQMIRHFRDGCDIVYGARRRRDTDSFLKKHSALWFYRVMRWFGVELVSNHSDFRLTSARVIEALQGFGESNLFLRGIFPVIGYPSRTVYYDRRLREAGKTKYSPMKLIGLAWDGITSFSVVPLRCITLVGMATSGISLLLLVHVFVSYWSGEAVPGWASIVAALSFFFGLTFVFLGIIGEYLGKIYLETKRRPRYFVERVAEVSPPAAAAPSPPHGQAHDSIAIDTAERP